MWMYLFKSRIVPYMAFSHVCWYQLLLPLLLTWRSSLADHYFYYYLIVSLLGFVIGLRQYLIHAKEYSRWEGVVMATLILYATLFFMWIPLGYLMVPK